MSFVYGGHSTRWVTELTGVSYRQLDYWARVGALRPSLSEANGSGTRRRYSDDDVYAVMVLRAVAASLTLNVPGSSLPTDLLGRVVACFRDSGHPRDGYLAVTADDVTWCPTASDLIGYLAARPALVVAVAAALSLPAVDEAS